MTRTQSLIVLFALTGCPAVVPEEPEPTPAEVLPAEGEWALRLSEGVAYGDCAGLFGGVPEHGEEAEPLPLETDPDDGAAEWDEEHEDPEDGDPGEGEGYDYEDYDEEGDEDIDCFEEEGAYCELPEPEPGPSYFEDVLLQVDVEQRGRQGFVVYVEGLPLVARVEDGRFEGSLQEHWGHSEPGSGGGSVDCALPGDPGTAVEPVCVEPEPVSGVSLYAEGELEGPTGMHGVAWLDISEGDWFCSVELRFDAARLSDFRDRGGWDEPVVGYAEDLPASAE